MQKYLISVFFILYIFFFGIFAVSADVASVAAADCRTNWWDPFSATVSPGSLQCGNSVTMSNTINECKSDGTWKDYYDCTKESATCENYTPASGIKSARCSGKTEAPTPTPTATPTPFPTIPPTMRCSGGYAPGEEHCTPDKKIEVCTPQYSGLGTLTGVEWNQKNPISENTCTLGACIETGTSPNRTAKCELAQPTATVTPTPVGATPTPDSSVTCPDPDGGSTPYKAGAKFCGAFDWIGTRTEVLECQNDGRFKKIGYCDGAKTLYCQPKGAPDGDTCSSLIQPVSESELACVQEPKPAQQLIPQPGVNCGIPAEDLPEGGNTAALACCYSAAADMKVMPLSCFITLPGAEDFFNGLSDKINEIFDCLPNFTNCGDNRSKNVLDVKAVKDALKNMPPCMPGAKPKGEALNGKDVGGTPLCTCERINTSTSALCDNINTTDDTGKVVPDISEQQACRTCMLNADGSQGNGVWTALGCINITSENGIIQSLFRVGIGIAGAIALLCNMYAAFMFQTSRGNPEGIKKAQDLITSCVAGLLLIIFSVFILRLIGYSILRIPGFG